MMIDVREKMAIRKGFPAFGVAPQNVQREIEAELAKPIKSADGHVITHGSRVYTNNLDRGTVDMSALDYEWHHGEKRWVPWFSVKVETDYKGSPVDRKDLQSDDRVVVRFNGKEA